MLQNTQLLQQGVSQKSKFTESVLSIPDSGAQQPTEKCYSEMAAVLIFLQFSKIQQLAVLTHESVKDTERRSSNTVMMFFKSSNV